MLGGAGEYGENEGNDLEKKYRMWGGERWRKTFEWRSHGEMIFPLPLLWF